ncbi:MAG: O-antigen ligase family protein [Actinomycetota bacterium]|nr:O-antigen ligase family protein [Actinomycetota bacterium]
MTAEPLQVIAALIACAAAGAGLCLRSPGPRYAAIGIGLLAALGLVAGQVWDQSRFEDLRAQPAVMVLAAILAATALGATAATFVRNPAFVAIAAFAVIALRLPVQVGSETNFLLVPLYGVIAGGWLRGIWLVARARGEELQQPSSPRRDGSAAVRWLAYALAASLVVYALGMAWTEDADNAITNVAFFLAPFAALLAMLRDLSWHRKLVGQVLLATALVALAFSAVAFIQYATRELTFNKDLQDANQLHLYFRVNSVFRDPNVLGRTLVFAIVALGAWIAWRRPARQAVAGALAAAVILVALSLTYSQTSFAALAPALGLLAWLRFGRRGLAGAAALLAAGLVALVLIEVPADTTVDRDRADLAEISSGRTSLISGGIDLFRDEPVVGQGPGGFAISFRRKIEEIERPISHNEPVTVAAEQGLLGLVPYGAVLLLSGFVMFRPWPAGDPARAGVAACYLALVVHSLGYAGFAIDPATWALLGLGMALRE